MTDPDDPIASRLNGLPKYVASRTLDDVSFFADGTKPTTLRPLDRKTTSTGVAVDVYEPAAQPTYGSFELEQ